MNKTESQVMMSQSNILLKRKLERMERLRQSATAGDLVIDFTKHNWHVVRKHRKGEKLEFVAAFSNPRTARATARHMPFASREDLSDYTFYVLLFKHWENKYDNVDYMNVITSWELDAGYAGVNVD